MGVYGLVWTQLGHQYRYISLVRAVCLLRVVRVISVVRVIRWSGWSACE